MRLQTVSLLKTRLPSVLTEPNSASRSAVFGKASPSAVAPGEFAHLDDFNPAEAIHHHPPITPATWFQEFWSGFKADMLSLLKGPPDLSKPSSHQ